MAWYCTFSSPDGADSCVQQLDRQPLLGTVVQLEAEDAPTEQEVRALEQRAAEKAQAKQRENLNTTSSIAGKEQKTDPPAKSRADLEVAEEPITTTTDDRQRHEQDEFNALVDELIAEAVPLADTSAGPTAEQIIASGEQLRIVSSQSPDPASSRDMDVDGSDLDASGEIEDFDVPQISALRGSQIPYSQSQGADSEIDELAESPAKEVSTPAPTATSHRNVREPSSPLADFRQATTQTHGGGGDENDQAGRGEVAGASTAAAVESECGLWRNPVLRVRARGSVLVSSLRRSGQTLNPSCHPWRSSCRVYGYVVRSHRAFIRTASAEVCWESDARQRSLRLDIHAARQRRHRDASS